MVTITQSRIDELVRVLTFGKCNTEYDYIKTHSAAEVGRLRKYILKHYSFPDEKTLIFRYNVGEIQILEAQKL